MQAGYDMYMQKYTESRMEKYAVKYGYFLKNSFLYV